jgi:hypothetical protein
MNHWLSLRCMDSRPWASFAGKPHPPTELCHQSEATRHMRELRPLRDMRPLVPLIQNPKYRQLPPPQKNRGAQMNNMSALSALSALNNLVAVVLPPTTPAPLLANAQRLPVRCLQGH